MLKNKSDAQLLEAVREGDISAYGELWERYRRVGYVAARSFASNVDVDDVVLEAYTRILEVIRRGKGPSEHFRPYLYQVIRSIAIEDQRGNALSIEDVPEAMVPSFEELELETRVDRQKALEAFRRLPEKYQQVLWLLEVEGLPPRDAAKTLGMTAGQVSTLRVRGRKALRDLWIETQIESLTLPTGCAQYRLPRFLLREAKGSLRARQRTALELHARDCQACRGAIHETRFLVNLVGGNLVLLVFGLGAGALSQQRFVEVVADAAGSAAAPAVASVVGAAGAGAAGAAGGGAAGAAGAAGGGAAVGGGVAAGAGAPVKLGLAAMLSSKGTVAAVAGIAAVGVVVGVVVETAPPSAVPAPVIESVGQRPAAPETSSDPPSEKPAATQSPASTETSEPPPPVAPTPAAQVEQPAPPPVQPEQPPAAPAPIPQVTGACATVAGATMTVQGSLAGGGSVQVASDPANLGSYLEAAAGGDGRWVTGSMNVYGAAVSLRGVSTDGQAGAWSSYSLQLC